MPEKTTAAGRTYEVDGRKFCWFPLDDDDQPKADPIRVPLRMKLGVVFDIGAHEDMDVTHMRALIERLAPGQSEALEDMDLLDFQEMFTTWQAEYHLLSGASLGESGRSSV